MNVELLRKVQVAIRTEPDGFNMRHFVDRCGTGHCIAGYAVAIAGVPARRRTLDDVESYATELLDLSFDQAVRLFFQDKWPEPFAGADPCDTESAVARIGHFIATEGRE